MTPLTRHASPNPGRSGTGVPATARTAAPLRARAEEPPRAARVSHGQRSRTPRSTNPQVTASPAPQRSQADSATRRDRTGLRDITEEDARVLAGWWRSRSPSMTALLSCSHLSRAPAVDGPPGARRAQARESRQISIAIRHARRLHARRQSLPADTRPGERREGSPTRCYAGLMRYQSSDEASARWSGFPFRDAVEVRPSRVYLRAARYLPRTGSGSERPRWITWPPGEGWPCRRAAARFTPVRH